MYEFRWAYRSGKPRQGWINIGGQYGPPLWQVLQERHQIGAFYKTGSQIANITWSEWKDIPFGGVDE